MRRMTLNVPTPPSSQSPSPSGRDVSERARARRLALGLSQFRVAACAGVSLQTYSLVERGGIISKATAEKLAPILACAPEDLLP